MFDFKIDRNNLNEAINYLSLIRFTWDGTEKQVQSIIGAGTRLNFSSKGQRSDSPWDLLKSGQPATLIKTGKLRDALFNTDNPSVTSVDSGKKINISFSGEHTELIPFLQKRFPLVVITQADFNLIGKAFLNTNLERIKIKFRSIKK